jgi:hypothetical protein
LVQKPEDKTVLQEASAEDRKVLEMFVLLEKKGTGKFHTGTVHEDPDGGEDA